MSLVTLFKRYSPSVYHNQEIGSNSYYPHFLHLQELSGARQRQREARDNTTTTKTSASTTTTKTSATTGVKTTTATTTKWRPDGQGCLTRLFNGDQKVKCNTLMMLLWVKTGWPKGGSHPQNFILSNWINLSLLIDKKYFVQKIFQIITFFYF